MAPLNRWGAYTFREILTAEEWVFEVGTRLGTGEIAVTHQTYVATPTLIIEQATRGRAAPGTELYPDEIITLTNRSTTPTAYAGLREWAAKERQIELEDPYGRRYHILVTKLQRVEDAARRGEWDLDWELQFRVTRVLAAADDVANAPLTAATPALTPPTPALYRPWTLYDEIDDTIWTFEMNPARATWVDVDRQLSEDRTTAGTATYVQGNTTPARLSAEGIVRTHEGRLTLEEAFSIRRLLLLTDHHGEEHLVRFASLAFTPEPRQHARARHTYRLTAEEVLAA